MRLSTGERRRTIHMEDVVFTFNNIVNEITSMYAGSFDHDSPMGIDAHQLIPSERKGKQGANPLIQPASPTLSEPQSARSTASSDSEDGLSLYSNSPEPSPTSSGFTTPPLSPTPPTSITDNDALYPDTVTCQPIADAERVLLDTIDNVHAPQKRSSEMDTQGIRASEISPSDTAPISTLEAPRIKLEPGSDSKPFLWTPSLNSESPTVFGPSEQGGTDIIYQTSTSPPVVLATPSHHATVPRLPPRPTRRDSPPHLAALRSPTLQSTPRLDQNEEWDTAWRAERNELGAGHLIRQRQWARKTIAYASSLTEPEDLPACQPVEKYLAWNSYSSPSVSPPRKRSLGALGRRVHVGPKMLPRGDWDPERRGGAIDRWNTRETLRRERAKPNRDAEKDSKPKLKPVVPLRVDTSRGYEANPSPECEIGQKMEGDDHGYGTSPTWEDKRAQQVCYVPERGQDTMRLCVQNGKRVLPGLDSDSDPQSEPESSTGATTSSTAGSIMEDDPNIMRWCVKNGARVLSQAGTPAMDPNSRLEVGSSVDAPNPLTGRVSLASGSSQGTRPLDQKSSEAECPYAPKKRSPLSITFLPISPATVKLQLRAPGDALGFGKTQRKFVSMIF